MFLIAVENVLYTSSAAVQRENNVTFPWQQSTVLYCWRNLTFQWQEW